MSHRVKYLLNILISASGLSFLVVWEHSKQSRYEGLQRLDNITITISNLKSGITNTDILSLKWLAIIGAVLILSYATKRYIAAGRHHVYARLWLRRWLKRQVWENWGVQLELVVCIALSIILPEFIKHVL
jgi:hypothetical protein